jgi:hypothetical protein
MAPPRRPDPEPLRTDDVTAVTVGTVAWGLLLVVLVALHGRLEESGRESWVWIAAAGFGLGLIGVRHVRRRRAASARTDGDSTSGNAPTDESSV